MQSKYKTSVYLFLFFIISSLISQTNSFNFNDVNAKYYTVPDDITNLTLPVWKKPLHPYQCPSEIYCYGRLLHTVQVSAIFNDSKYFVDMQMKQSEADTLASFDSFMADHNQAPTRKELLEWVLDHFSPGANSLIRWDPPDWKSNPTFLGNIKDTALREWAASLNNFWSNLGRKFKPEVYDHPELFSFVVVPNPVIVPGGRFLEFYYWDSYWVLLGLLHCEMFGTTRGIINNFRSMIQTHRHIPNGGRVYYLGRSQPPLLPHMIKAYLDFTSDKAYVMTTLDDLETEYKFFEEFHSITVKGQTLFRYIDDSSGPRPESYKEDYFTAEYFENEDDKEEFYSEMKAGAESGMDFTSRWFITASGTNDGLLHDIKARSIVPVELNAIMYQNALIIVEIADYTGDSTKAELYRTKAKNLLSAIEAVLWDDIVGAWLDYDIINQKKRNYFSGSNLTPLYFKAYSPDKEAHITAKVLKYIASHSLDDYPGGVPNTLANTGEQWDFPNVWAPIQHWLIIGLDKLSDQTAKELAFGWAEKWVRNNFIAFKDSGAMFEKYSAIVVGDHGGGGEYETQIGFGWSNGVIIDLLNKYGDRLMAADYTDKDNGSRLYRSSGISVCMLSILTILIMIGRERLQ